MAYTYFFFKNKVIGFALILFYEKNIEPNTNTRTGKKTERENIGKKLQTKEK
jgi:hypothetical protein